MTTTVTVETICDRLAELDEEINVLERDLAIKHGQADALRSLLPDDEEEDVGAPPQERDLGKGQAPAGVAKPQPKAGVKGVSKYNALIRDLLQVEPLSQSGIAMKLGNINQSCFNKVIREHPWFEKIDGLWHLTEAGRTGG